jgi:cytochrome d ubiquinol oxidase subunit I
MNDALLIHRLQFAFTVTYHYLFPQLTMGLALLLVVMKTAALRSAEGGEERERWNQAARFWGRIFALNFGMGVVTGIPMEFQFGTNWSAFSRAAGAVVGQPLAMEGVFSFFLESSFLGLFLFGEKKLGPKGHWFSTLMLLLGSWLSGYFVIAADAWMQHPVGHQVGPRGEIGLASLWGLLANPWAIWQYAHNMSGAVITASFVMASVGAYYLLSEREQDHGRRFVRLGVLAGFAASLFQLMPSGDFQGRLVARYQPAALAAMEGLFTTTIAAPVVLVGQPDVLNRRLDNALTVPGALSFLTYRRWGAEVTGLAAFPAADWPDNIPLLYYSYHIMVGLGTIFILVFAAAALQLRRGRLYGSRRLLWVLMLSLPFPYIANTAGWMTAELGRQPWLIYGLMRTAQGSSAHVSAGNAMFTLIGFCGIYTVLGLLFAFLVLAQVSHGPQAAGHAGAGAANRPVAP